MMDIEQIDVLGLSETNLKNITAKEIYKRNTKYTSYFANMSDHLGSGVGLIFHNYYAKYIHKIESYKGRVISATLLLKGHIKLKIIQVYFSANQQTDKEITIDIQDHVISHI